MPATFTVHARLLEEHSTTRCIEVEARETEDVVFRRVAAALGVGAGDIALTHEGSEVVVDLLGEGSEVVVRLTQRAVARKTLQGMEVEMSDNGLCKVIGSSEREDEEKAYIAQLMLDAGGHPMLRSLCLAARRGLLEVVEVLTAQWSAATRVQPGYSPLCAAAQNGHLPVVQHLLKAGVAPVSDKNGNAPIHLAAGSGHLAVVRFLVEAGVSPTTFVSWRGPDIHKGVTPLGLATRGGHTHVVAYLKEVM